MRLRLYHHHDGARVAYREAGTGPPLALLHSKLLSHREWEPLVEELGDRYRLILPDLPLHGDSEDRPRHPYTPDWITDVIAGFCTEVAGRHPLVGGHGIGAELLLRGVERGMLEPARMVIMPNRLHGPADRPIARRAWLAATRAAAVPGLDRAMSHGARLLARPDLATRLTVTGNPEARDLVRHAFSDVGGNGNRARSWAKFARRWPVQAQRQLLDAYPNIDVPVLLLWAEDDPAHPLVGAQEALDLIPEAQLRTLPGTGFLMAYDDPVGVARELISFFG